MRNQLKVLAVLAALAPALALAAIANSKHDLSSGSTAQYRSGTVGGTDQTCAFCHTPHFATQQPLIWSHIRTGSTTTFGNAYNTVQGTPLPTTDIAAPGTKRCMDCHDATVALGAVSNIGGGTGGSFNVGNAAAGTFSQATVIPSRSQIGPNLNNNHPVGIPYAGQGTYNGITSGTTAADVAAGGFYYAGSTTSCATGTGLCTAGSVNIELVRSIGTGTGFGIECVSCHEPHNRYGFLYLLRGTTAGSGICLGCHIK